MALPLLPGSCWNAISAGLLCHLSGRRVHLPPMIRAVLYLRSSKDRADASPAAQRRQLEEMAKAREIAIVGEFVDAVESGKDDDRPGFQQLLTAIRDPARAWDHILALDTARIARRRALAIIFEEHECKRRGIRVLYKSLPESDPITEMLLKSILQAMDEWHSLTSKVKGVAGMAENVRQGWRAGGSAPRGYKLAHTETGAVRDGEPVTKSKLTPNDDALKVRAYLQHRAKGVKRVRALELAGASWPISSLVEMERNALVYAGHTVWNRSSKRTESGYEGGSKWRPRSDWIIQRDTHDALISEEEAEIVMSGLKHTRKVGGRPARRVYLFAGLLFSPTGDKWHGDSNTYRLGKGVMIAAENLERAMLAEIMARLQSGDMSESIAAHYRKASKTKAPKDDAGPLKRRITEIDKKIARLADLLSETSAPAALLRQVEGLEEERDRLAITLAGIEADSSFAKTLRLVTAADVRNTLKTLAEDISADDPEAVRDLLRQIVERVELCPKTWKADVHLRFGPASKTREWLATPRGVASFPGFAEVIELEVPHNNRRHYSG